MSFFKITFDLSTIRAPDKKYKHFKKTVDDTKRKETCHSIDDMKIVSTIIQLILDCVHSRGFGLT